MNHRIVGSMTESLTQRLNDSMSQFTAGHEESLGSGNMRPRSHEEHEDQFWNNKISCSSRLRGGVALAFAVLALVAVSAQDQWPQFRGTQAGAVADDPSLPDTWSETQNVAWKTEI